jgi:ribosomal RNA-processing protein 12
MVAQLSAEQDGVRYNASGALQSLLNNCATRTVVVAMQQQPQQGGMGPLQSLVAAVAAALGARYQEAWGLALPGKTGAGGGGRKGGVEGLGG